MPWDKSHYESADWPTQIYLNGTAYDLGVCDQHGAGVCYSMPGITYPHVTVHGVEGADPKKGMTNGFHVVCGNGSKRVGYTSTSQPIYQRTDVFEYDSRGKPNDFVWTKRPLNGVKATGSSAFYRQTADNIAADFVSEVLG